MPLVLVMLMVTIRPVLMLMGMPFVRIPVGV